MSQRKIKTRNQLASILRRLRRRGKRAVFTNGCFDILHLGHVRYLEKARLLGDCLIVGLNSDESVRRLKGRGRPIHAEKDRAGVLAGLECVDFVAVFNEQTPLNLIKLLRPDVLVKGSDWKSREIVGAKEVHSWGGKVRRIALLKGRSTTAILKKLKKL